MAQWLRILAVGCLLASCVERDFNDGSSSSQAPAHAVAMDPNRDSILGYLAVRDSIAVCLVTTPKVPPALRGEAVAALEGALKAWLALVQANPSWPNKKMLQVRHAGTDEIMRPGDARSCVGDLTLFLFADASESALMTGGGGGLVFTNAVARSVVLTESAVAAARRCRNQTHEVMRSLFLQHEVGHLLGLADTFEIPGNLESAGFHPSGIMGVQDALGCRVSLGPDDAAALNVLVEHLFGRRQLGCPAGYRRVSGAHGSQVAIGLVCQPEAFAYADPDDLCASVRDDETGYRYRLTRARDVVVVGGNGAAVTVQKAHPISMNLTLFGRRIHMHLDSRGRDGRGIFVFSDPDSGLVFLRDEKGPRRLPLICKPRALIP